VEYIVTLYKLITRWIGIRADRDERRIAASIEFRNTFIKELQGLYPEPVNWPKAYGIDQVLRGKFDVLRTAVQKYEPFVPKCKRAAFQKAWREYSCGIVHDNTVENYSHYKYVTTVDNNALGGLNQMKRNGKQAFKHNVEKLLSFAPDI
jgi:hypothetical protein